MMTKLADELEALAKDATPGPWRHELEGSSTSRIRGADDPNFSRMAAVIMDRGEANAELIIALFNNLPIIITALRQPDAVPGDLVERLNWVMGQLHNCQQWHEEPDPDGKGTLYDWIIQGTDNGR